MVETIYVIAMYFYSMVNNHITGLVFYPILDRIIDQYG